MAQHEGPVRCREHRFIADDGCPVHYCDDDHPLKDCECGPWCDFWERM